MSYQNWSDDAAPDLCIKADVSKPSPYQNISKENAQEIADVFFKGSIEMAIASLKTCLELASKQKNIKLMKIIKQDIETYTEMWTERELEILEEEKDMALFESEIERLKSESYEFREDRDDYVSIKEEEKSIENAQNIWEKNNKL